MTGSSWRIGWFWGASEVEVVDVRTGGSAAAVASGGRKLRTTRTGRGGPLVSASAGVAAAGENYSTMSSRHDFPCSSVLRHQPRTHKLETRLSCALCCSWTCDGIPIQWHSYSSASTSLSGVANQLIRNSRGWSIRSRKSSLHALICRGLILYQASWRSCSFIREQLTHLLVIVVREVDLSCQTYGDDYPVQLARSLRLIHPCSVEASVFLWFFGFHSIIH